MNKSKPLNFIIPCVIFPFDIMFSINEPDERLEISLMRYGLDASATLKELETSSNSLGRTIRTDNDQVVVRMKKFDKSPKQLGALSHEIFHAATFVLESAGVDFRMDYSDEAYAYLIGYITQSVFEKMK